MGEPKAMVELASVPLVSRVVSIVGSAGLEPVVVAKPDTELPRLGCRVLSEPTEPHHPLTGLIAALGASAGRAVIAIACDMPLIPPRLVSWIAQLEEEVAICEAGGRLQPLFGRYSPSVCDRLVEALERGDSMTDAVTALNPFVVTEDKLARFGEPERMFFNINSPDDLKAAEKMLKGGRFPRAAFRSRRSRRGDSPAPA
jgi:molybdopterin-guanine dinucleotide biosynthesis protein A